MKTRASADETPLGRALLGGVSTLRFTLAAGLWRPCARRARRGCAVGSACRAAHGPAGSAAAGAVLGVSPRHAVRRRQSCQDPRAGGIGATFDSRFC